MAFGAVTAPHGVKRPADDDLQNEQRLAKRFDRLNLEQYGLLKVPIEAPLPTPPVASFSPQDTMLVDDTRHRVYISNLQEAIEEAELDEPKSIFLPDIEKKLAKLPPSVLSDKTKSAQDKQMILYKIPVSLTVPEEKDSVRKAIIESRERARAEQARKATEDARVTTNQSLQETSRRTDQTNEFSSHNAESMQDPDEMDIG